MLKKTLCSLLLGSSVLLSGGCATPEKTSYEKYQDLQSMQIAPSVDAVILVAEPRDIYEHLRVPVEWIYEWVIAAALKDNGVKRYTITFNATTHDLFNAVENPEIQTIVVAGHGEWDHWCASDTDIHEYQLKQFIERNHIPKKKGLFIRHTCGADRFRNDGSEKTAFGTSVMDNITKTRGYDFLSSPFDYIFSPIPEHKQKPPVVFAAKK